jgi:transposase
MLFMLGNRERMDEELFVACSLRELVPDDYVLKKVDRVLDLSWLRREVADLYCADNGRPSLDPEAALRLMLAGFFHGIVHDRKLMREAGMHLGMRWFAGFALHEPLPDHSSLTRLRQRWGAERFKRIFERTVEQCIKADLVGGETVHVDATLIRADVSWESLVAEHADKVIEENAEVERAKDTSDDGGDNSNDEPPKRKPGRPARPRSPKKRSTTDPDCTLTTNSKQMRMTPCYKQHTAVDDRAGVVLDAEVTTGETSEGRELLVQLDRVEQQLGAAPKCVTADAGYAHGRNWTGLAERGIEAVITPQPTASNSVVPKSKFKYDARHNTVTCPRGQKLRTTNRTQLGQIFRSSRRICKLCPLRQDCLPGGKGVRTIAISDDYVALLRARRKHARQTPEDVRRYRRHRWIVEGRHGEAKTQHGLGRAVRRGLANVRIQAYLTAAVMNLKRLAKWGKGVLRPFWKRLGGILHSLIRSASNSPLYLRLCNISRSPIHQFAMLKAA